MNNTFEKFRQSTRDLDQNRPTLFKFGLCDNLKNPDWASI